MEDDDPLRQVVILLLKSVGCAVHSANDGWAALAMLDDTPNVDNILCDERLPNGMERLATAAKILARFPAVEAVLISGNATETITSKTEHGQRFRFLQKPFMINELFLMFAHGRLVAHRSS